MVSVAYKGNSSIYSNTFMTSNQALNCAGILKNENQIQGFKSTEVPRPGVIKSKPLTDEDSFAVDVEWQSQGASFVGQNYPFSQ